MPAEYSNTFEPVTNSHAMIQSKGLYNLHPVYTYDSLLYVKIGTGYVRLRPDNRTSKDNVFWNELNLMAASYATQGVDLVLVPRTMSVVKK